MKYNNILMIMMVVVMSISLCWIGVHAGSAGDITSMYKPDLAYRSQFFNIAAFCDAEHIKKWDCGTACNMHPNFHTHKVITSSEIDTMAYVGVDHDSNQVVVAFRGSHNNENWCHDIETWKVSYEDHPCPGDCEVHEGFLSSYQSLQSQIRDNVKELLSLNSSYTLLVTGHSLGAAMATLSAIDLSFLLRDMYNVSVDDLPMEVYVLGSPRIGNEDFVKWAYAQLPFGKHFRITHHKDPVPHLPFESMNFIHIPTEVYYPAYNNFTEMVLLDSVSEESDDGANQFWFYSWK